MTPAVESKRDLSRWIIQTVKEFTASSPDNAMWQGRGEKMWAEPLIGFSSGEDDQMI